MGVKHRRAFTLVELLLYVSMAGVLILAVSVLMAAILSARVKNRSAAEVEQQGARVLSLITQAVRNADAINAPTIGTSAMTLSLNTYSSPLNPTFFDSSGGVLRITEGVGSPIALTNSKVAVSGLSFQNLSYGSTPGLVRVQFTLASVNPSGRNEYDYSRSFAASAALRQP